MANNDHLINTTIYVSYNSLKSCFFRFINYIFIPDKTVFVYESDRRAFT